MSGPADSPAAAHARRRQWERSEMGQQRMRGLKPLGSEGLGDALPPPRLRR